GLLAQAKELTVIATIKPLYSLVANVMGTQGKLELMVKGGLDPHIYRIRPSNIRQLYNADVIFYIDPNMETFLKRILDHDNGDLTAIAMARQKGIALLPRRTRKIWYTDKKMTPVQRKNDAPDLHIWLDPANARRMVRIIEETLSAQDPAHRLTYIRNASKTIARLYRMEEDIREKLRPLRHRPMIVYHDAFQYFEQAFGLKSIGAILLKPDQTPSIKHINILKKLAREKKVTCVLAAPGVHPRIATIVLSRTQAGFGIVDPLGLYQDKGPDLYFNMMEALAQSIIDCQDKGDAFKDFNNNNLDQP
ncbi:MAG: zinc ABC transporter substrate-binding protein, partial [Alphaproteobacteria bacterium]|nr:zinc ABC transporter substrate-binding protein [Alphaproteobacteria bacterium]